MNTAPIPLFVNPAAGRGRAGRHLDALRRLLDTEGVPHSLLTSAAPGDLERKVLAAATAGARRVLVAGGDGSIHEAVNGILRAGGGTALGILPVGTGNDFAKASAIPLAWELAACELAHRLRRGTPARAVDAGRMNERFFANGAGIGFDARVTRIAHSIRLPIGDLVYLIAVLKAMREGIVTPELDIRSDARSIRGPMTLANLSNGPWIGGMFRIAPDARNDDGRLNLVCAGPLSRLRVLALLPRLMRGTHIGEPEVSEELTRRCLIEARSPVPSHLDGEVQPLQTRFDIEVLPGALRLL